MAFAEDLGPSFEDPRGDRRFAAGHAHAGGGEGDVGGVVREGEQRFGLLDPPLAQAQVGELGQRVHAWSRAGVVGHPERGLELILGLGPLARGHQHAAVVGATAGVEERAAERAA